ncbi:MAG: hypothetical protein SNJ54_07110 [Anaerolineae bacterium]
MKLSQSSVSVALAILLAATVILIGRLLTPSTPPQSQSRLTALTPGAQLAVVRNPTRDKAEISIVTVDSNGFIRQSTQQRLYFQTPLTRIELANNGTMLMHESVPGNPTATVRSVYDYSTQLDLSNCQFTALSPDGQTIACVSGTEAAVSPTARLGWTSLPVSSGGRFGAPRLFNETVVVPHALEDGTIELVIFSHPTNVTLATLDPDTHYVFNRAGTKAVALDGETLRMLNFFSDCGSANYALPAELAEYRVRPVVLSDRADQVLLYTEPSTGGAAQMVVWQLATNDLTWLSAVEATGHAAGDFHPDGTMVAFTIGQNIYIASLTDGRAYWMGRGLNPVWIIR